MKKENAPITHSIQFRDFAKIVKHGTTKQINRVLEDKEKPETVWAEIHSARQKTSWLDSLELAHKKLKSGFDIEEFEGTVVEMKLISKIQSILDKLKKIAKKK